MGTGRDEQIPNCKHSITSSSYFGLQLENKSDISSLGIGTPEKLLNSCLGKGMVRPLNDVFLFLVILVKKIYGDEHSKIYKIIKKTKLFG